MKPFSELNDLVDHCKDYYLNCFKDCEPLCYLPLPVYLTEPFVSLASYQVYSSFDYYTVASIDPTMRVAILKGQELTTDWLNCRTGDQISTIAEQVSKNEVNSIQKAYFDELQKKFTYMVIVVGNDDVHLVYYFQNKEQALSILEQCETLVDLDNIAESVKELFTEGNQLIENTLVIRDYLN